MQTFIVYAQQFGVKPIHIEKNEDDCFLVSDIKNKFLDKLIEINKEFKKINIDQLRLIYMGTECKDDESINKYCNYNKEILINMYLKNN
jgi:hypothetical protein